MQRLDRKRILYLLDPIQVGFCMIFKLCQTDEIQQVEMKHDEVESTLLLLLVLLARPFIGHLFWISTFFFLTEVTRALLLFYKKKRHLSSLFLPYVNIRLCPGVEKPPGLQRKGQFEIWYLLSHL